MLNVEAIDSHLRTLDSDLISSTYQKRLRSTQERLRSFLDSLPNSVDLYTATSNDIRKFLVWSDAKVHSFVCPSLGQQGSTICSCPMRLSAGSVQNLLQQVADIYVQLGKGSSWDSYDNSGNPALSPLLKYYVKLVKEEQANANVLPRQAKPLFLTN